jgi:hypothetical protein
MATSCHPFHPLVTEMAKEDEVKKEMTRKTNELITLAAVSGHDIGIILCVQGDASKVRTYTNCPELRVLVEQSKKQLKGVMEMFRLPNNEIQPLLGRMLESDNTLLLYIVNDYISMYGSLPKELSAFPDKPISLPKEQSDGGVIEKAELKNILVWYYRHGFKLSPAVEAYISSPDGLPSQTLLEDHTTSQMPIMWDPTKKGSTWTNISKLFREIFYGEVDRRKRTRHAR